MKRGRGLNLVYVSSFVEIRWQRAALEKHVPGEFLAVVGCNGVVYHVVVSGCSCST